MSQALAISLILVVVAWSILRYRSYQNMVQNGSIKEVFDHHNGEGIAMVTNPAVKRASAQSSADAM